MYLGDSGRMPAHPTYTMWENHEGCFYMLSAVYLSWRVEGSPATAILQRGLAAYADKHRLYRCARQQLAAEADLGLVPGDGAHRRPCGMRAKRQQWQW